MGDFCKVDLSIMKPEDRQQTVRRVSVLLLERISIDDAQLVLKLPCRVVVSRVRQIGGEGFRGFDIPGYSFPFFFMRGNRHVRPFSSSPPTGWSSPSPTVQISNVVCLRFRIPTKVLWGDSEEIDLWS